MEMKTAISCTILRHKIRVNATCRKCPHKVHRMEMKTAISCTILRHTKILIAVGVDRKSGSAGMPRPISYAVFCLKKKKKRKKVEAKTRYNARAHKVEQK